MPLDSILIETDAPYQKPVGFPEKLNNSKALIQIVEEIASLKGLEPKLVQEASYDNSCRFFGIRD